MMLLKVARMWSTVILLPLHPASLTYKIIPKDAQKFMACVPLDAKIDVFVEYPFRLISVAVLVAVV